MIVTSLRTERRALDLALEIAGSATGRISTRALADHFGQDEVAQLISQGILAPSGQLDVIADDGDVPRPIEWSSERESFGYFSETGGWVELPASALSVFALQSAAFSEVLTRSLDPQPKGLMTELVPDHLWDIGACRLPGRSKRVSTWLARRLHVPAVWRKFVQAMKDRPSTELRLVLHLTGHELRDLPFVANQAIVAVGSVVASEAPLTIDSGILSARLKAPQSEAGPLKVSADGGVVEVNGKTYIFAGDRQRQIALALSDAWQAGSPRLRTSQVLADAGSKESIRTLARAFKGHPNWREILREKNGFCWIEV